MVSFVLLFPTMCEYCPPTNRCDHVRPVARGGFEGFDPLGGGGGGRGGEKKNNNISLRQYPCAHHQKSVSQDPSMFSFEVYQIIWSSA